MAFKHVIDKEAFDKLSDDVKKEYEEKDGQYYLQVEGMVPKARLDEFRENNIKLAQDNDKLKRHVDSYGAITPAELEELRKKAETGGGEVDEEQLNTMVEERVAKRVSKMNEEHESALKAEREARGQAETTLSKLIIDTNVQTEAVKAGVRETAVEDVLLRARNIFRVENGSAVPYKDDEIVYGKDGKTPQTIGEWLADQASTAPHLFKENKGGGATPPGKPGQGGAGQEQNVRGVSRMHQAHMNG